MAHLHSCAHASNLLGVYLATCNPRAPNPCSAMSAALFRRVSSHSSEFFSSPAPPRRCPASVAGLKPIGITWSYLACRVGFLVPFFADQGPERHLGAVWLCIRARQHLTHAQRDVVLASRRRQPGRGRHDRRAARWHHQGFEHIHLGPGKAKPRSPMHPLELSRMDGAFGPFCY
jgi:hypothetical protein